MEHLHAMRDTDKHFIIDAATMVITNANEAKNKLRQGEHDSEIFTFELPKTIEGHDMSLCDHVRVHYINISSNKSDESKDVFKDTKMHVSEDDPSTLILQWKISGNATKYAGNLNFRILFACTDGNSNFTYKKWTEIYKGIIISDGFDNSEAAMEGYADIIEQWENELFGAGESVIESINAESEAQKRAIEQKGAAVLASIPEDYTNLANAVDGTKRTKATAIIQTVAGNAVVANDCSGDNLRGLKVYGKSTQAGEPSPENPQEINSVENLEVVMCGKNHININHADKTYFNTVGSINGESITITTSKDESVCRAQIPVVYPLNVPLTISFEATMLQGADFMGDKVSVVYFRKGKESTKGAYLNPVTDKQSYAFTLESGLPEPGYELWLYVKLEGTYSGRVEIKYENIQVEVGENVTDYESYKEEQKISIPYTLHGIPVSSGGNYTDADGQQWIADEVDMERGVYIQRIKKTDSFEVGAVHANSTTTLAAIKIEDMMPGIYPCISTRFHGVEKHPNDMRANEAVCYVNGYIYCGIEGVTTKEGYAEYFNNNPTEFLYALAEPIETPLTVEEIETFKALRTNYLATTVLNDAGAWMEVEYNADTRAFIENAPTVLTDQNTGKKYNLVVIDGALSVVAI